MCLFDLLNAGCVCVALLRVCAREKPSDHSIKGTAFTTCVECKNGGRRYRSGVSVCYVGGSDKYVSDYS